MKRTNKKVLVKNGRQWFERSVYVDDNGREYFKYNGVHCPIIEHQRGGFYYSPYFTRVIYT